MPSASAARRSRTRSPRSPRRAGGRGRARRERAPSSCVFARRSDVASARGGVMKFRFLREVPAAPEKDWLEARFAELRRELDATPEDAPDERWIELAERWDEIKAVYNGEDSRRSWCEAQDARDEVAAAA